MNNLMQMIQMFQSNPMQILSQRFNIPMGISNNPQQIIQHLLNTGQISQSQVDDAMRMRNNPMFRGLFGGR